MRVTTRAWHMAGVGHRAHFHTVDGLLMVAV